MFCVFCYDSLKILKKLNKINSGVCNNMKHFNLRVIGVMEVVVKEKRTEKYLLKTSQFWPKKISTYYSKKLKKP